MAGNDEALRVDDQVSIKLLGPPIIVKNGRPLNISSKKGRAIIYYLAANERLVRRGELISLLWPDNDLTAALHSLSVCIHNIRKQMPGLILIDNEQISLNHDTYIDVRIFKQKLSNADAYAADLHDIISLYRGPFLDELEMTRFSEYYDWVIPERENYLRLAVNAHIRLAEIMKGKGDYRQSRHIIQKAITLDPLQEDLYVIAMQLSGLAEDRLGAAKIYEQLQTVLQSEMNTVPLPQTQKIYHAVVSPSTYQKQNNMVESPSLASTMPIFTKANNTGPFVGREMELEFLEQHVNKGQFILIEGPAGIGKTRLVMEYLNEKSAIIIRGVATELEQSIPFYPLLKALRGFFADPAWEKLETYARANIPLQYWETLRFYIPELQSSQDSLSEFPGDKYLIIESINRLLLFLSKQNDVILFIDDLQWADSATLTTLYQIVIDSFSYHLTIIATVRKSVDTPELEKVKFRLHKIGALNKISLLPLSNNAVIKYLQYHGFDNTDVMTVKALQISAGIPFLLNAIKDYIMEKGPPGEMLDSMILPQSIQAFCEDAIGDISKCARTVMQFIAVYGIAISYNELVLLEELPEEEILDALEELQKRGVLSVDADEKYDFKHDLNREYAYQCIEVSRRNRMHWHIAEGLKTLYEQNIGRFAPLLVYHYSRSNMPEYCVSYALLGGHEALRLGAWDEAVALYEQAAIYATETTKQIEALLLISEVHANIGNTNKAMVVTQQAARKAAENGEIALSDLLQGASLLLNRSDFLELVWGTIHFENQNAQELKLYDRDIFTYVDRPGTNPHYAIFLLVNYAYVAVLKKDLATAIDAMQRILSYESFSDWPIFQRYMGLAQLDIGAYKLYLGHDDARDYLEKGLERMRCQYIRYIEPYYLEKLGELKILQSNYKEAATLLKEGLIIAEKTHSNYAKALIMSTQGRLQSVLGDHGCAIQTWSAALELAQELGAYHLEIAIRNQLEA